MMLIDRLSTGKYKSPTEAEQAVARQKLFNPEWDVVEAHFGRPAPEAMKKVYRSLELLRRPRFRGDHGGF